MGLLGTGTESRLLSRRLEAVGLEHTLEGLRSRALAGAAATNGTRASSGGRHCREINVSSGSGHLF